MKTFTLGKTLALSFAVAAASVVTFTGSASAAMIQYNPAGNTAPTTPVFNTYYDVPNGIGNEAQFVRVKTKAGSNAEYSTSFNSTCNSGDVYTVWTYVHNGASQDYNQNGTGSAVAHGTAVSMQAPLNQTKNSFYFSSTISASNASGVQAGANLNCASNKKLTLVSNSVKTYSVNTGYNAAPDSAVNGRLALGSNVAGSGDVWACWAYRIAVYYDVTVSDVVTPTPTPTPKPTPTPTPTPTPKPTPTPTTVPAEMPKTGAEGIGLLFAGTTATGIAARELITRRRK